MKSLVVCHEEISKILTEGYYQKASLFDHNLTLGLIDTGKVRFEQHRTHKDAVLVEKKAFSVNYRDKASMLGNYERCMMNVSSGQLFYFAICSEFIATVIKTGKNVTTLKPGDRVIPVATYPSGIPDIPSGIPSNYASRRLDIFHEAQLIKIPDEVTDEQAASLTIGAQTSYAIIRRLSILPGANILVTAATSNTSLFILETLKHLDANIYTLSTRDNYSELLMSSGLGNSIKETYASCNDLKKLMPDIEGFDVVIDPFADIYLSRLLPYMKVGAQYITCGIQKQHYASIQPASGNGLMELDFFRNIIGKNITVMGNCLGRRIDLEKAIVDTASGKLHIHIDSVYTGNQIKEFFDRGFNEPKRFGKVVFKYTE